MSHSVTVEAQLTNKDNVVKAARELAFEVLPAGTHKMFDGQTVVGYGVKLPAWKYPAYVREDGKVVYDNYNEAWGKQVELDKLIQRYSVLQTVDTARSEGYLCAQNTLENGDVEILMTVDAA